MEAGTRARLREAFREDNERLSAATGRDWAWHG
jgi:hypothetical protein